MESNYCDILCLTEHWLADDHLNKSKIRNFYIATSFARTSFKLGGTMILARQGIKTTSITSINKLSIEKHIEFSAIKCFMPDSSYITIVTIYHSPAGDFAIFLEKLTECLELVHKQKYYELVFCADFNVDFLKTSKHRSNLVDLFQSYGLRYCIEEPTRITAKTATCIDNIFVTSKYSNYTGTVITSCLSDHTAQSVHIKTSAKNDYKKKITSRSFTKNNINTCKYLLDREPWNDTNFLVTLNDKFNSFYEILLYYFNISFPIVTKHINVVQRKRSNWITTGLIISSKN